MTDEQFEMVFNAIANRRAVAEGWLKRAEKDSGVYRYAEAEAKVCKSLQESVQDIKWGRNLHRYKTKEEA
jgi:hypothetical protein